MEGLYQIATGAGNVVSGVVNIPPHMGTGRGGVESRSGALPVVAVVSDASFHTKGESGRTCFGSSLEYLAPPRWPPYPQPDGDRTQECLRSCRRGVDCDR